MSGLHRGFLKSVCTVAIAGHEMYSCLPSPTFLSHIFPSTTQTLILHPQPPTWYHTQNEILICSLLPYNTALALPLRTLTASCHRFMFHSALALILHSQPVLSLCADWIYRTDWETGSWWSSCRVQQVIADLLVGSNCLCEGSLQPCDKHTNYLHGGILFCSSVGVEVAFQQNQRQTKLKVTVITES